MALLASIIGLDSFSNGGRGIAAVAAAAKDPAALFAKRSPGARGGGFLMQTKPGHHAPALSHREGAKPPPPVNADTAITYNPEEAASVPAPPGEEAPTPFGQPAIFDSFSSLTPPVGIEGVPSLLSYPGGGGGGGGGGCEGGCGSTSITTPPAVPEPSVWAILIVGFFGVGAMMRAKRRSETAARSAPVRAAHR